MNLTTVGYRIVFIKNGYVIEKKTRDAGWFGFIGEGWDYVDYSPSGFVNDYPSLKFAEQKLQQIMDLERRIRTTPPKYYGRDLKGNVVEVQKK